MNLFENDKNNKLKFYFEKYYIFYQNIGAITESYLSLFFEKY